MLSLKEIEEIKSLLLDVREKLINTFWANMSGGTWWCRSDTRNIVERIEEQLKKINRR